MSKGPEVTEQFLLLQRRPFRDRDDLVEGIGLESGRLTAVAKGARRKGSAISGLLEPPVHLEVRFRKGRGLDLLSQPTLLDSYSRVKRSLPALMTAGFLSRLFLASLADNDGDSGPYYLLQGLLERLAEGVEPALLGLWGQDRLLLLLGVGPNFDCCSGCGSPDVQGYAAAEGGVLCAQCYGGEGFALPSPALSFARFLRVQELGGEFPELTNVSKRALGRLYKEHFQMHVGVGASYFKRVLPVGDDR